MGSIVKISILVSVCLSAVLFFGCEDEKKTVCCECTCFNRNNTTGETLTDTKTISGENLNCQDACRSHCDFNDEFIGWEMENGVQVKCSSAQ